MTKDKALKLALDALEGFIPYLTLKDEAQCNRYDKAITALRLAIDVQNMASESTYKEQLETKDEPVAIVISESGANVTHSWWHEPALPIGTKLYTSPQRTWVGLTDEDEIDWEDGGNLKDLFKAIEAKLREKNT